jgi:hypothetical protein
MIVETTIAVILRPSQQVQGQEVEQAHRAVSGFVAWDLDRRYC